MYWTSPDQTQEAYARLDALPAASPEDPGFFAGALTAPFVGLAAADANLAALAADVATPSLARVARNLDDHFGTGAENWLYREQQKTHDAALAMQPQLSRDGLASQVIQGFFRIGSEAIVGGAVGAAAGGATGGVPGAAVGGVAGAMLTVGGAEGTAAYRRGLAEGLDADTALRAAAIEGITAGVGATVPAVGPTLRASIALGVSSNIGLGAFQRGATHQVLADAGYAAQAAQYRWNDRDGLLADGILGAAFGGIGHKLLARSAAFDRSVGTTDAALTVANARHVESVAPGIPTDIGAANEHVAAFNDAIDALIHDRPVEVAPAIDDAKFVADPGRTAYEAEGAAALREHAGPLVDLTPEPRSRTIVEPERDSLSTAIAKLGGLDLAQVRSEWGPTIADDRVRLNQLAWAEGGPFGKHVLRSQGRPIDDMASALAERGYLPVDEHGKPDLGELFDRLRAEAGGERQFAPQGIEARAGAAAQILGDEHQAAAHGAGSEAAIERQAIQAEASGLRPEHADLPVPGENGEVLTAAEAHAQLQTERADRERLRQMVEAAASCEGALQ